MSGIIGTSHSKSKVVGKSQDTAKAWVNFRGSDTFGLRNGFNISSVTDNGVGNYYVNFAQPMSNTDYVIQKYDNAYGVGWSNLISTSQIQIYTTNMAVPQAQTDAAYVYATIHGD